MSCEGSSAGWKEQGPQQMGHLSLREPTEKGYIYPVRVCAAGLSVWFCQYVYLYVYNYVYMCICVCVTKKTSVLYLAGHNSSQNPVQCLLLRFICRQRCRR